MRLDVCSRLGCPGPETAIIGAVASIGLLATEPVARWLRSTPPLRHLPHGAAGSVIAGILQGVVVLGTARLAGLQHGLILSGVVAGCVLVAATAVLALIRPASGDATSSQLPVDHLPECTSGLGSELTEGSVVRRIWLALMTVLFHPAHSFQRYGATSNFGPTRAHQVVQLPTLMGCPTR